MPSGNQTIWVLHNNSDFLNMVHTELEFYSTFITIVTSCEQIIQAAENCAGIAIIGWSRSEKAEWSSLLRLISWKCPHIPTIIIADGNEAEFAEVCIKQGAFDVISKPVDLNRLKSSTIKALQFSYLSRQNRQLENYLLGGELNCPEVFESIITRNSMMFGVFKVIETISSTCNPVLITGEPGVGKSLIAMAIHKMSCQKGPCIALNAANLGDIICTELLPELMRNTSREENVRSESICSTPNGYTLVLDEDVVLNECSQGNTLNLLSKKCDYRFSSNEGANACIRVVTTSCKTIEELLSQKTIRKDLFHRLCAHHIHIPALRERQEDIPLLAQKFIDDISSLLQKSPPIITYEAITKLMEYNFSENVRELKSMLEKAVSCNSTGIISFEDLRIYFSSVV